MGLSNILSHYDAIVSLKNGEPCRPRFVDLHTSNRCNQRCAGCAYGCHLDNTIMSEEDHVKVVNDLVRFGVKAFDFAGGGDPLCLPYAGRILDMVNSQGCSYGVITNGSMMKDNLIEQIVRQATYIRVSFEASNPEDWARYKGVKKSMWDKTVENVSKLIASREAQGSSCEIAIKFGVGKTLRGHKHYADGIAIAEQIGVDNVQFKAFRHEPEELAYNEKVKENSILDEEAEGHENVRRWLIPAPEEDIPQCWLNPLHTVVDYLGNVYICCYYYYRDEHCIGNMLEQPIEEFWMSEKHQGLIRKIKKNECAKVDCKFFRHHKIVEQEFKRGRIDFL